VLSQSELKKHIHYNPDTGIITRILSTSNRVKVGSVCDNKNNFGYIRVGICGRRYQAHTVIWLYMTGKFPKKQVDHMNHIRDDNRWCNLREVTSRENSLNCKLSKNNTSGFSGVSWNPLNNNWRVRVMVLGETINVGSYRSKTIAINKSKQAYKYYGFHENHGSVS